MSSDADHASFEPLTPTSFLVRAATVYSERTAFVADDQSTMTYEQLLDSCQRQAGALVALGVKPGDRVAVLAPNGLLALSAHYSVPMAGAVLVAMNTRLRSAEWAYIVARSGAQMLIFDDEYAHDVADIHATIKISASDLMARTSSASRVCRSVTDERSLISLNYTSGTTGRPKGAMYHHRGAYLQALSMAFHAKLTPGSVHLWTLPMFHCNGWAFTWAVTAAGGCHVSMRKVDPAQMWELVLKHGVNSFNAAPTVLIDFARHAAAVRLDHPLSVGTGGAPPSPTLLATLERLNVSVTHLYGLTETFGPSMINENVPEWSTEPADRRAVLQARQGNGGVVGLPVRIVDDADNDVPADGHSVGEVIARGNTITCGYYDDPESTAAAYRGGWFHTGDLGVLHPNGQLELRDRAKDVIISGGENISSIEVEQAVARHPDVVDVAVVARPDERWGEVPVAFVEIRSGARTSAADIMAFARDELAHFKAPKHVEFTTLPRTSTGKIQKFLLRGSQQDSTGSPGAT